MRNISFLILISTLLFNGCKKQKTAIEEPDPQSLRQEVKPTEVSIAEATYRSFEFRVNSSGTISSENEVIVTFQSGGLLERLQAKNGKYFRKGQVLAELENKKQELTVEKARLAVDQALVNFNNDSIAFGNKLTPVIRKNLTLKSGLSTAKVSLKEAELNLENTITRAPISGIMAEIEEQAGNVVSSGKELGIIYDPNNLVLTGKVLETDFKHIKIGLEADIFPLSFPDRSFGASIVEFNPKVDQNGMITVKMKLNETEGILPGMNANAVIRAPQSENVIVPREALVMKSGRPVVFTYEDGLAKWKYVELGLDNGVDLEIKSGVEAGSAVIVSNNLQLAHDARVTVSETNLNKDN